MQAAVHVRQEADDGVLEDVRRVEPVARRVPEAVALDGLERALGLRRHLDVLVAELERELVHERDVDGLEEAREDDAAALAHEDLDALVAQVVGLHVQVGEDGRRDGRVAQHLGDLDARRLGDLLQERALVAQDDARERVLACDAQERLARLVEHLEGGREGRGRREEDRAEGRKVRLDERVRLDASVRRRLRELELGAALDEAVAVAEAGDDPRERLALEETLRLGGPAHVHELRQFSSR